MPDPIRWGILGTGYIAHEFSAGLSVVPDAEIAAVGSRKRETAEAFAAECGAEGAYGSYEAVAEDPSVDVVYVATPHPMHRRDTLMCLEAGKAVVCEKPFAINEAEARDMIDLARARGVFLMEALWTRFLPVTRRIVEWVDSGAIGEVRQVTADCGFAGGWRPEGRLLNPALGGGSLLDVGVYAITFAALVLGNSPKRIVSLPDFGKTGVDEQMAAVLQYESGALALVSSSVRTQTPHDLRISGSEGIIRAEAPLWRPPVAALEAGDRRERFDEPMVGNGFHCEAAHVGDCLRAGLLESEVMSLDETLAIMAIMDRIRAIWGLKYPVEATP